MDWIKNISDSIGKLFEKGRKPLTSSIPPVLLLCEILNRPGLSATALAAAVIAQLAAKGFPTGKNPDGSENMNNQFIYILCQELINEIKNNAVVESAIPTGTISATGVGGNAGGPVTIQAFNDKIAKIKGIIR